MQAFSPSPWEAEKEWKGKGWIILTLHQLACLCQTLLVLSTWCHWPSSAAHSVNPPSKAASFLQFCPHSSDKEESTGWGSLVLKVQRAGNSVAGFGVLCEAWVPTPIHHAAQTALARSCLKTERPSWSQSRCSVCIQGILWRRFRHSLWRERFAWTDFYGLFQPRDPGF